MSDKKKITIEKREFKIANGEKFILEYPSNFEEITNKKLSKLQQDYDSAISNNINQANNNIINSNDNNNNYYQPIGELKNENLENNSETKLEPQEGFIEINPKKNDNKNNNVNTKEDIDDEEINSEEFHEVEENENLYNKNLNNNIINNKKDDEKEEKKRDISPVKDAENIKLSMKKFNFKTPKWAENMTDEDFIKMARNRIKK